jgi:DNA gyrase/topoisomerase IV subunit B
MSFFPTRISENTNFVIFREKGEIKICNDGRGIPVRKWAQDESIYIPTLIFGRLLTSDNFNDDQKRITGIIRKTSKKSCRLTYRKS